MVTFCVNRMEPSPPYGLRRVKNFLSYWGRVSCLSFKPVKKILFRSAYRGVLFSQRSYRFPDHYMFSHKTSDKYRSVHIHLTTSIRRTAMTSATIGMDLASSRERKEY